MLDPRDPVVRCQTSAVTAPSDSGDRSVWPSRTDLATLCFTFFALGVTVNVLVLERVGSEVRTVVAAFGINAATTELAYLAVRDAGGTQVAALIAGWVVASRFGLLAASLGARLRVGNWHRAAAGLQSFDPNVTFAILQPSSRDVVRVFWRVTAAMHLGWFTGTIVGVTLGNVIGDADRFGLDAVFPAALLADHRQPAATTSPCARRGDRRWALPRVDPARACGHPDHREPSRRGGRARLGRTHGRAGGADVSWTIIALLAAGVWAQRLAGMFVGGRVLGRRPSLGRLATLIPAAVIMAVIVQLTLASGKTLTIDARAAGMAVAGFLVWRRAPFVVIVVGAAAATALVRML